MNPESAGDEPRVDSARLRDYLDDRLSGEALESFEAELLQSPELLEQLALEQRLRDGLRELAADPSGGFSDDATNKPRPRRALWLPLAASFVAGAMFPGMLLLGQREFVRTPPPVAAEGLIEGNLPAVLIDRVRGAAAAQRDELRLPAEAGRVVLEFPVYPASPEPDYELQIHRDGRRVVRARGLRPDGSGLLRVLLATAALPDGSYRLELRDNATPAAGPELELELEVSRD